MRPSLNFGLEILSAVTSCICAIVRPWIYADRILSDEADSTIYGREFHAAELGRSLSDIRGDSLHLTDLEKWPNQTMKPTPKGFASRLAPLRCNFSVFATTPCRGLSLPR